jgi:hypothetical protein
MQSQDNNGDRRRNVRLALMLAALALSFYVGFILMTGAK